MGDAITTPFDVFLFIVIFYGTPFLLFGMPVILLIFLSVRRTRRLHRRRREALHPPDEDSSRQSNPYAPTAGVSD